jgi:2-keto-4-pentenoate hydratase/2-oxohepta-3-ene-1,7-dioic acid hydratase in catechol pathway
VVIGRRCSRASVADAMDAVFGYTCVNDVTARDFQREDGVFARAKGFDSFCPVGPAVVAGLDPRELRVRCAVGDVVRQDGPVSDMVFGIPELIAFVSAVMTLLPGDLLVTGTPAGVGPLVAGDRVVVTVDGIGSLANPVVDRADR